MERFYTPLSILIATIAIGGALIYTNPGQGSSGAAVAEESSGREQVTPERSKPAVDPRRAENRNVKGSEDAQVTIVEFSDYECPFCARIHPTLEQLVEEFGGDVNWEFRHLPLVIHSNARPAAIASECVAELGGNDAFWEFGNFLFANQKSLNERTYTSGAKSLGIDTAEFAQCLEREDIAERVLDDERTAMTLGGGGTPFSVIIYPDGTSRAVSGALPYNQFKALVQK